MKRTKVKSSNIKSVGHDQKTLTLEIEFTNGSVYQYSPITDIGYTMLVTAESVGKFFNQHIKKNKTVKVKKIK